MRIRGSLWQSIFRRDKGICQYCGIDLLSSFSTFNTAQVDHINHVCDGGKDEPTNLILCCVSCNQMLSRANTLKTVEARRAHILKRTSERKPDEYDYWVKEIRQNSNGA